MGFFQDARQFWRTYGWHILLIGLVLTFLILFIINQWSINKNRTSITFTDIYEHFLSMILKPHAQPTERQRQRRMQGGKSRGEASCKEFIEFYFQKPFAKIRPDFLKNPVTGENLELDMYNEDLRVAIEYNGSQHYHYNPFMHGNSKDKFRNQQYRDMLKKDMCQKNNIVLITVPYTVSEEEIGPFLFEELKKHGLEPHPEAYV